MVKIDGVQFQSLCISYDEANNKSEVGHLMWALAEGNAARVYIPSCHLRREQGDPRKNLFPFGGETSCGSRSQKCPSRQIISTQYLDCRKLLKEEKQKSKMR